MSPARNKDSAAGLRSAGNAGAFASRQTAEAEAELVAEPSIIADIDLVERLTGTYEADCDPNFYHASERVIAFARQAAAHPAPAADRKDLIAARDRIQARIDTLDIRADAAMITDAHPDARYVTAVAEQDGFGGSDIRLSLHDNDGTAIPLDPEYAESLWDASASDWVPGKHAADRSPLRNFQASADAPVQPAADWMKVYDLYAMSEATPEAIQRQ